LATQLLDLLKANSESKSDIMRLWIDRVKEAAPETKMRWLDHGVRLGTLPSLLPEELASLMSDKEFQTEPALAILFRARRLDFLHSTEALFDNLVSQILDRKISAAPSRRVESPLDALSHSVDGARYAFAFRDRQPISLEKHLESRNRAAKLTWSSQIVTNTEAYAGHQLCVDFANVAEKESQRSTIEWATELDPWDTVIEAGRSLWGERWALVNLANVAAGIRSTVDKCADCPELLDTSRSLARRIRFARLRSGAHKWWSAQLVASSTEFEASLALLAALTWMTTPAILTNSEIVDAMLAGLDQAQWNRIFNSVRRCASLASSREESGEELDARKLPDSMSQRLASLIADRVGSRGSQLLFKKYIEGRPTEDTAVLEFVQRQALDIQNLGTASWAPDLQKVRMCYELGVVHEPGDFHVRRTPKLPGSMPLGLAQELLRTPVHFPGFLLAMAEERCHEDVASKIVPVARIAESEGWFTVSS
jgi:hypothetical protein